MFSKVWCIHNPFQPPPAIFNHPCSGFFYYCLCFSALYVEKYYLEVFRYFIEGISILYHNNGFTLRAAPLFS